MGGDRVSDVRVDWQTIGDGKGLCFCTICGGLYVYMR